MKIKEEFKRTGEFWLPSTPERKVSGTLSIVDGGEIELEVTGLLGDGGEASGVNLRRIVGHVQKDRSVPLTPVTLDDCGYKIIPTLVGIPKSLIRVNRAFIGVQYGADKVPHFNALTFSVEGIEKWVQISGIKVESQPENDIPTISYERPNDFALRLENNMELLVTWAPSWEHSITQEARISENILFRLVSQNVRKLDDFISVARKIITFLCFAVNQIVCLDSMQGTAADLYEDIGENKTRLIPIDIYCATWPYSKNSQEIAWYNVLLEFKEIQEDAELIINSWVKGYEESASAFNLYFLTQIGGQTYLEERFLTLIQGLESYHRSRSDERQMETAEFKELVQNLIEQCPQENRVWLEGKLMHGNELNLRNRIKKMIEPFKDIFGNKKKRKTLIKNIVDTRNHLTHYGFSLESSATESENLWTLCQKMELLFQLNFLQLTSFNREEIDSIVTKCPKLQKKISL